MPRKTAAEKAAEQAAAEAAAAEEARRRTEKQRLTWAGLFIAAIALFAIGYVVGDAGQDDVLIGADTATAQPTTHAQPTGRPGPESAPNAQGRQPGQGRVDRAGSGPEPAPPQPDDGVRAFQPGFLGVGIQQSPAGVVVVEVADDTPADAAGFEVDDVIVSFDGTDIATVGAFAQAVRTTGAGSQVEVVVLRNGSEVGLMATLGGIPN